MIGATSVTITSELAQSLGEVARDYPEARITIAWDRDELPENEWTITVSDGPDVPTPIRFRMDDRDKHSYVSNYGGEGRTMSEPIILYPWRVKHASGVEHVVVTRGTSHIEAISAAQEVERYKFDCGDTDARTFHPSPIVVLERQAPVWQAHDALLEEYIIAAAAGDDL